MNSNITEKLSYTLSAERINGYKKRIIHKYGKCNGIDCYVYYRSFRDNPLQSSQIP